jgi:hypothetical protein
MATPPHGPDGWASDMSRQRILERRGLDLLAMLRLRKEEVFEELIERLTSVGIEPLGREHRLT